MPIFGLCMPIFGLCMPIFIIVVFICFGGFVCLFYLQFYTEERRMLFFYLTDFLHTHTHTHTHGSYIHVLYCKNVMQNVEIMF